MNWIALLMICSFLWETKAQIDLIPQPKNAIITQQTITDTGFWVTWDLVSKADSYRITISPPTIGAVGVGRGITDKFTAIAGLSPDTEYTVQIIPVKGSAEGTPAVVWQRTALPAPTSFFVVTDTVTADTMVVGWSKVENAESYTLTVQPSAGVSGGGSELYQTSVTLRGLTENTLYTLTIKPKNWVGYGGATSVRQLTKLPPPSNVRVLSETISHNTMSIHWDKVAGADTYEVKVSPSDGVSGAGQGIPDTYTILRNMQADTQYLVQVSAMNGAGPSEFRQVVVKTLSICYAKGQDYTTDSFKIFCPSRCARNQEHVYGTREYTDDSYICAAAVHDSRVDDNIGGEVTIKKRPGMPHYVGTTKNGVISKDYGSWHKSFVFALQAPENLRAILNMVTYNSITIEWEDVKGAEAYRVTVEPDLGVSGAVPGIKTTRTTLGNLKPDFEYRIYLTATNTLEHSEAAVITQFTSLPKPMNLKVLSQSVTSDRFNMTWLPVAGASHYLIKIETEGVDINEETTKLFYLVDGMPSGSKVTVGVSAVNSVGAGEESFVTQYTRLSVVENVRAESITDTRMQVEWDTVSGATIYVITTIPSPMQNATRKTKDAYIWLEGLSPDTTYDIRVQAENGHERSRSITIKQKTALGSPLNLQVVEDQLTDSLVMVTWDKMKNAKSYYVSIMSYDNKFGAVDERTDNSFTAKGLLGSTEYKISVNGRNEIGDGRPSSIGITTLIPAPRNLRIHGKSVDADQVQITWEQHHGATGYMMVVMPPAGIRGAGRLKDNNAMIYGLKSSVKYQIFVCVLVGPEQGMNATTTFVTGLQAPDNVRTVIDEVTDRSIMVEWDVVVLAEYYKVTYKAKGTIKKMEINNIYNTSAVIENLRPKTEYQISVQSMESANSATGGLEEASMATTINVMTKVTPPGGLRVVENSETTATIAWLPVQSALSYVVHVVPHEGVQGTGNLTLPPVTLSNLTAPEYTVYVFSMDNVMNVSSFASQITVKPGVDIIPTTTSTDDYDFYGPGGDNYGGVDPLGGDGAGNTGDEDVEEKLLVGEPWVIIVIIIAAILIIIIFAVIPCICDCCRNKPLLKYHGCCGCCASCSDYGCCACRGCCPGGQIRQKMLPRNQSYASTVAEQPRRLKSSGIGGRHISYTVQSNY